jgi:hypothetical protein
MTLKSLSNNYNLITIGALFAYSSLAFKKEANFYFSFYHGKGFCLILNNFLYPYIKFSEVNFKINTNLCFRVKYSIIILRFPHMQHLRIFTSFPYPVTHCTFLDIKLGGVKEEYN